MFVSLGLSTDDEAYRRILDAMSHIVWVTDAEGQTLYMNQPGLTRLGVTPQNVAGWGWLKFLHPDDIPGAREAWLAAVDHRGEYRTEYRLRQPDGSYRWYLAKAAVMPGPANMPTAWVGTWTDIDDRHRAEVERDAVLQQLRRYIDRMPLGYVLFDSQMRVADWNPAAENMFGYRRDEMLGCGPPFEPLLPPSARAETNLILDRVRAGDMAAHSINENLTKNGDRIICEWFNTPQFGASGEFAGLVSLVQDITARHRSAEQLRLTTAELRALTASVSYAREAEGVRIARELHDELGGSLSAIKWDVERLASSFARGDEAPKHALRERLAAIATTVGAAVQSVQRIASELRPSMLDDLGLIDAIEWQAQEFERRTGITTRCNCAGTAVDATAFSPAHATAIFRIFQEALTNVMRHARASTVAVGLECADGVFTLSVRDDGIGITLPGRRAGGGLGLVGMRERAALIGAVLTLARVQPNGTELLLQVPLDGSVPEAHP